MRLYRICPEGERLLDVLKRIGVDEYALQMTDKGLALNILVKDATAAAANILKQEALASGMDAAVKRGAVSCSNPFSDVLLMGAAHCYGRLIKRLKIQPFGLKDLGRRLAEILRRPEPVSFFAKGREISLERPLVMGILNVTPDSFSDGGEFISARAAAERIDRMLLEGADIVDIGGESSRPYASGISCEEEIKRIDYPLKYAADKGALISVDTRHPETAFFAVQNGASLINDITGLSSSEMAEVCAASGAAVCIMHMKGQPENMMDNAFYDDLIGDLQDFFRSRIEKAVKAGVDKKSIILDVGFGFGKTAEQNYALLKYMDEFGFLGLPLLAGISRKSMIGAATGGKVSERLAGTVAANTAAILKGAHIIRVHDVKEGADTVKVAHYIKKAKA